MGGLVLERVGHRTAEAFMRDVMTRMRECRQETARELVFALRAGLETLDAVTDGVVDAAVIAEFEMQTGKLDAGAPITAVKRISAAQGQRHGEDVVRVTRKRHLHIRAQRAAEV